MQRRHFLAAGAAWSLWSTARAEPGAPASPSRNKLVVIMLRGAVDGMSVVAPYGERAYAAGRPTIGLKADELIRLDPLFGLHPSLAMLKPYWEQGALGFVHASGSPDPTRSHFDAQDYMESGTPGRKGTPDGWMNRLLAGLPGPAAPTRAVSMGATPPRIFGGTASVAVLGVGRKALEPKAIDDPRLQAAFSQLYGNSSDATLARNFRDATEGRGEMKRSLMKDTMRGTSSNAGDQGAPSARTFAADARRLGTLIRMDPHTQLAFTSVGGWDTHANQGNAQGQLANRLASLGEGLEALAGGLGDAMKDTVIVVMSEFGRTLRENGNRGTDHGRGNVMWLLGGPVAGGRMIGEWPGLDPAALVEGRDLAVATDFRQVLAPILRRHLGADEALMARVFPDAPQSRDFKVLNT